MKIKDLATAMKLAKITNRPLEDFYDAPESEETEQDLEEEMEDESEDAADLSEEQTTSNVSEVQCSKERTSTKIQPDSSTILAYIDLYGGRMSDGGKLICEKRQMTRKEYLAGIKNLTEKEILNHPLMFLFFRAEEQAEGHFWNWLARFPKE